MKTNLFTTCRGILATLALDGLACFGELIKNFTGLITAERRESMKNGTVANQITLGVEDCGYIPGGNHGGT